MLTNITAAEKRIHKEAEWIGMTTSEEGLSVGGIVLSVDGLSRILDLRSGLPQLLQGRRCGFRLFGTFLFMKRSERELGADLSITALANSGRTLLLQCNRKRFGNVRKNNYACSK